MDSNDDLREVTATLPVPSEVHLPVPVTEEHYERGLEPQSTLQRYYQELAKYPPLSREEEHALAIKMVEENDLVAARKLVVSNLRLVVKIAMEYRRAWTNALDLIQEGNTGLLEAVKRYDPYKDVRVSSYAAYWIRAYILKYLIDNIRMVRIGSSRAQRKLFFRLNKEKRELERQGFEVSPTLLAERLDVTEDDVREMEQRLAEGDISFDAPLQREGSHATVGDLIDSKHQTAEEEFADRELKQVFLEQVLGLLNQLDEREQCILRERILAEEPKTLQEIGDAYGLTRERVRQLENQAIRKLREHLKATLVDFNYHLPEVIDK